MSRVPFVVTSRQTSGCVTVLGVSIVPLLVSENSNVRARTRAAIDAIRSRAARAAKTTPIKRLQRRSGRVYRMSDEVKPGTTHFIAFTFRPIARRVCFSDDRISTVIEARAGRLIIK